MAAATGRKSVSDPHPPLQPQLRSSEGDFMPFLQHTYQRYSLRQILSFGRSSLTVSGNILLKRVLVLQYPYRSYHSPASHLDPDRFRQSNEARKRPVLSWRSKLLSRTLSRSMASNALDPMSQERRPSTVRQTSVAPEAGKTRSEVFKKQLRGTQFNSMVSQSVNKTALHPGGVEYVYTITIAGRER